MSDVLSTTPGTGWAANPDQAGAQHQAIFNSRPIYQAAGARRAPALDTQNAPSDLYTATYSDSQYAIGVVCVGASDSFFGGLAAQELGAALHDWLWSHRASPPSEHEITGYTTSLQTVIREHVNTQALSGLLSRGGPADLIRRREQVGSQTSVGLYLLALDGTATFYLLGNLRAQVYATDPNAAPTVFSGDPRAAWSSLHGLIGAPVWRTLRPVQGISLAVADLPADWGRDYRPLYQPNMFGVAAAATAATVSVAYVTAMIDPNVGPTTAAPGPPTRTTTPVPTQAATRPVALETAAPPAAAEPAFARSNLPPAGSPAVAGAWPAPDPSRLAAHSGMDDMDMGLDDLDNAFAQEDAERGPRDDLETTSVGLNRMGGAPPRRPSPLDLLATLPDPMRLALGGGAVLLGLILIFLFISSLLSHGSPAAAPPTIAAHLTATPVGAQCFEPSNACISGRILAVWTSDGGLDIFGKPLGPLHFETVDGQSLQVQWFERYRMELHPENKPPYDVLFSNLGVTQYAKVGDPNVPGTQRNDADCRWFDDVKHNVCGDFLKFWTAHGRNLGPDANPDAASIALFGLPISEEIDEPVGANGLKLTVQWFQKARFESHPANKPPYNLQMGLLGNEAGGR